MKNIVTAEMQSPKSSVGSKSSNGWKDNQFRYYQNDEGIAEVLRTSWIRRLNLKPTSPIATNQDDPPPISPPPTVNSPSSTGSGATLLCHRTTISTDESHTPSSMFNARTTPFLHRLLKHHKEDKPTSKTDLENFTFPCFGPFQIKNRRTLIEHDKVTGLGDDDRLEFQEGNGNCEIRDLGQVVRWDFNGTRNSCENIGSRILEEKEEQKRENNSLLQQNWLSTNHKTLFTEKALFSSESNFTKNRKRGSFSEKRIADDVQRIPLSQFFGCSSASKKNECLRENTPDRISTKNEWPMTRVYHDIKYLSRIGSTTCHESCNDGGAGRICRYPHLSRHSAVLRKQERHAPANPNQTEEPSSFWNINRFQRAGMISSIFRACRTSTKNRFSDSDEFVSVKSRKLGHED